VESSARQLGRNAIRSGRARQQLGRLAVESWITSDFATKLFQAAGQNLDKLIAAAARRDFKPVTLGMRAKLNIHNSLRTIDSHNVIAKLTGSDPDLKKFLRDLHRSLGPLRNRAPKVNGDKIYHGGSRQRLRLRSASGNGASPTKRYQPRRAAAFIFLP